MLALAMQLRHWEASANLQGRVVKKSRSPLASPGGFALISGVWD